MIPIKICIPKDIIFDESKWKISILENWHTITRTNFPYVILRRIEHDYLIVSVSHSVWAQELKMSTHALLEIINKFLDQPRLKKIVIHLSHNKDCIDNKSMKHSFDIL